MSTPICSYHLSEQRYKCPHPEFKNGLCIFHIEKPLPTDINQESHVERQEYEEIIAKFHTDFLAEVSDPTNSSPLRIIGYVFPRTHIMGKTISRELTFRSCKFNDITQFGNVVFEKNVIFRNCKSFERFGINGSTFNKDISIHESIFQKQFAFGNNSCEYFIFYRNEVECEICHFGEIVASKSLSFADTTFQYKKYGISQSDEIRHNSFSFNNIDFNELSHFSRVKFNTPVTFNKITVDGLLAFGETEFNEATKFNQIEINGRFRFIRSKFVKTLEFRVTNVKSELYFDGDENRCFLDELDFTKVNISKDANVVFDKANLTKTKFSYTNLENIKFLDVTWHNQDKSTNFRKKRPKLWEEVQVDPSDRLYERVEDNYRQLVNNYEKKRDFETSEQFHVGEMEVRRKKLNKTSSNWWKKIKPYANATAFYWLTSRYGSSYRQAGLILLILAFLICPILFLFTGFKTVKDANPQRDIDLYLTLDSSQFASLGYIFNSYLESLSYTFSIITFQKDRFYEPIGNLPSQFALYLCMFLLTTQAAFLLLAIRRQFKR